MFRTRCIHLTDLDLRELVIGKNMLQIICEMPAIRHLALYADWREIESTGCHDQDYNIQALLRNTSIVLLDFKGYGHVHGPPQHFLRRIVAPKVTSLIGLSGRMIDFSSGSWLFRCDALKYLDLDIETPKLCEPKMVHSWACLSNLESAKFHSVTVTKPPPLRNSLHLHLLILDMPLEGDFQDWVPDCVPVSVTQLIIARMAGYKRAVTPAFSCFTELKLLYLAYQDSHPSDCSFIALPPSLEYFVMLENNDLASENWDYIEEGRRLKGELPKLRFKLNAYAIPCRDDLWKEVWTRVNVEVKKPVVFDWNVPCFRDHLDFTYEYKCKTFFYVEPKKCAEEVDEEEAKKQEEDACVD
ncbi:unnamed protein product [Notodromas monacha]|uniref:Uncharacterized protein n=1 Tax=Notodromas monacha TaxID=399045 RepID=A0A7R9GGA6_9CRUS|nr:unnamed protein product [Notodromas monacha]CAG0920169.1 unnamed protein product [Notodromas monacha]